MKGFFFFFSLPPLHAYPRATALSAFLGMRPTDPVLGHSLDCRVTATDASFNTGGTISVNGWTVKIPKNLQVGFPAAWIPWKDFVANKALYIGYEVSVSNSYAASAPNRREH